MASNARSLDSQPSSLLGGTPAPNDSENNDVDNISQLVKEIISRNDLSKFQEASIDAAYIELAKKIHLIADDSKTLDPTIRKQIDAIIDIAKKTNVVDLEGWIEKTKQDNIIKIWAALCESVGIKTPKEAIICKTAEEFETALEKWIKDENNNASSIETLTLSGKSLYFLPESIGNLLNLHTLRIQNTNISFLPESIGNLQNLKVLDIQNSNISSLPESISTNSLSLETIYLPKHISLSDKTIDWMIRLVKCNILENLSITWESMEDNKKLVELFFVLFEKIKTEKLSVFLEKTYPFLRYALKTPNNSEAIKPLIGEIRSKLQQADKATWNHYDIYFIENIMQEIKDDKSLKEFFKNFLDLYKCLPGLKLLFEGFEVNASIHKDRLSLCIREIIIDMADSDSKPKDYLAVLMYFHEHSNYFEDKLIPIIRKNNKGELPEKIIMRSLNKRSYQGIIKFLKSANSCDEIFTYLKEQQNPLILNMLKEFIKTASNNLVYLFNKVFIKDSHLKKLSDWEFLNLLDSLRKLLKPKSSEKLELSDECKAEIIARKKDFSKKLNSIWEGAKSQAEIKWLKDLVEAFFKPQRDSIRDSYSKLSAFSIEAEKFDGVYADANDLFRILRLGNNFRCYASTNITFFAMLCRWGQEELVRLIIENIPVNLTITYNDDNYPFDNNNLALIRILGENLCIDATLKNAIQTLLKAAYERAQEAIKAYGQAEKALASKEKQEDKSELNAEVERVSSEESSAEETPEKQPTQQETNGAPSSKPSELAIAQNPPPLPPPFSPEWQQRQQQLLDQLPNAPTHEVALPSAPLLSLYPLLSE